MKCVWQQHLQSTLSAILMLCLSGLAYGASDRERFLDAEKALTEGDHTRYQTLKNSLKDYPLLPYLDYQELTANFNKTSNSQAHWFINQYKNTPLASRFKARWLNHLGKKRYWRSYLAFYTPQKSAKRQCYYLSALLNDGQKTLALSKAKKLWLSGNSQPDACNPVFKTWEKAGYLTDKLRWQRIELAMQKGKWKLARYIGRKLPAADQIQLNNWIVLHRNPSQGLASRKNLSDNPFREKMLIHGVKRLANRDAKSAKAYWAKIESAYDFSSKQKHKLKRHIALNVFNNDDSDSYHFLKNVQPCNKDTRLQEARIRAGLLHRDWASVLLWINNLPEKHKNNERWSYWRARANFELGEKDKAITQFTALAKNRSYYGFMAADHVNTSYNLNNQEVAVAANDIDAIRNIAGIQRASELFVLNRPTNATREWYWTTKKFDKEQLKAAAKHAQSINWLDQSIFTLAKTGYWEDLDLRFPLEHRNTVKSQATNLQLEPIWVYGILRQESAFNKRAKSHAGARGLMQLMPATARHVAKTHFKKKLKNKEQLFHPETNIELGTAYLRELMDKWQQNMVLATASYNAGPHRVKRWLPQTPMPADIWVELIPFKETRGYVRAVMSYSVIYERRLGLKTGRLATRMPLIKSRSDLLAKKP